MNSAARIRPYYGTVCNTCGPVEMTELEYELQMDRPNRGWICAKCGDTAMWDDDRYEASIDELGKAGK